MYALILQNIHGKTFMVKLKIQRNHKSFPPRMFCCIWYIITLWPDVVCSFLCTTDDASADHTLIHYVHHIMCCMLLISTCLNKVCHMCNARTSLYVHPVKELLLALLQYSHFSQTSSFYNMTLLCSSMTSCRASLTNVVISNSFHIPYM